MPVGSEHAEGSSGIALSALTGHVPSLCLRCLPTLAQVNASGCSALVEVTQESGVTQGTERRRQRSHEQHWVTEGRPRSHTLMHMDRGVM